MWDMETGDRSSPCGRALLLHLSEMQVGRVFWDLVYPERSYIVAGGANDSLHCPSVMYSRKIIEGTEVVQEIHSKQKSGVLEDTPAAGQIHFLLVTMTS
ncbi:hypothetical protein KUCAC02_025189 [Chaenocephalus aceratus]|nr:hypothetical protein KUCAC02_025189 [Chaenocephalus aceratus]